MNYYLLQRPQCTDRQATKQVKLVQGCIGNDRAPMFRFRLQVSCVMVSNTAPFLTKQKYFTVRKYFRTNKETEKLPACIPRQLVYKLITHLQEKGHNLLCRGFSP